MHFIEREVTKLNKKYKTKDPFEICDAKKIECKIVNLHPEVNGIYQYVQRNKFIYINGNLPKSEQIYTCYHELGHAILHEKYNCTLLKTCTFFNPSKFELEAEIFAAFFVVPDLSPILKLTGLTLEGISHRLNIPMEYLKLRLKYGDKAGHLNIS